MTNDMVGAKKGPNLCENLCAQCPLSMFAECIAYAYRIHYILHQWSVSSSSSNSNQTIHKYRWIYIQLHMLVIANKCYFVGWLMCWMVERITYFHNLCATRTHRSNTTTKIPWIRTRTHAPSYGTPSMYVCVLYVTETQYAPKHSAHAHIYIII